MLGCFKVGHIAVSRRFAIEWHGLALTLGHSGWSFDSVNYLREDQCVKIQCSNVGR